MTLWLCKYTSVFVSIQFLLQTIKKGQDYFGLSDDQIRLSDDQKDRWFLEDNFSSAWSWIKTLNDYQRISIYFGNYIRYHELVLNRRMCSKKIGWASQKIVVQNIFMPLKWFHAVEDMTNCFLVIMPYNVMSVRVEKI